MVGAADVDKNTRKMIELVTLSVLLCSDYNLIGRDRLLVRNARVGRKEALFACKREISKIIKKEKKNN